MSPEFIQLTAPSDGSPVYIRPTAVTAVWEADAATAPSGGFVGRPYVPGVVKRLTFIEAASPDGSPLRVEEPAAAVVQLVELAESRAARPPVPGRPLSRRALRRLRRVFAERSAA